MSPRKAIHTSRKAVSDSFSRAGHHDLIKINLIKSMSHQRVVKINLSRTTKRRQKLPLAHLVALLVHKVLAPFLGQNPFLTHFKRL